MPYYLEEVARTDIGRLRVYSQPLGGEVRQYRDNKGLEVDAIVQAKDAWAAFEVKLGGEGPIDEAASSLLKFAGEIDAERSVEPALLAVARVGVRERATGLTEGPLSQSAASGALESGSPASGNSSSIATRKSAATSTYLAASFASGGAAS